MNIDELEARVNTPVSETRMLNAINKLAEWIGQDWQTKNELGLMTEDDRATEDEDGTYILINRPILAQQGYATNEDQDASKKKSVLGIILHSRRYHGKTMDDLFEGTEMQAPDFEALSYMTTISEPIVEMVKVNGRLYLWAREAQKIFSPEMSAILNKDMTEPYSKWMPSTNDNTWTLLNLFMNAVMKDYRSVINGDNGNGTSQH